MPVIARGGFVTVPIQVFVPPVPAKSKAVARPLPASDAARTTVTPFLHLSMPEMLAPHATFRHQPAMRNAKGL